MVIETLNLIIILKTILSKLTPTKTRLLEKILITITENVITINIFKMVIRVLTNFKLKTKTSLEINKIDTTNKVIKIKTAITKIC